MLRAGLFGRKPATRLRIARRLGVGFLRVFRIERTGIRALTETTCITQGGAAAGTSIYPVVGEPATAGSAPERPESDRGAVLGVSESGRGARPNPTDQADPLAEPGDGVPLELIAFLVTLTALLGAVALAVRRAHVPPFLLLAAGLRRKKDSKPLLFLDVDGVIALWPFGEELPPHSSYEFGDVQVVVADRCGELIRRLSQHFEIVLATGWEDRVTRLLERMLGLERRLRALKFGSAVRGGLSDWKIGTIQRAAAGRPLAWVDDMIGPEQHRWAEAREGPTLLVTTDRSRGLTEDDTQLLLDWAEIVGNGNESYTEPKALA
jgi:hypothetical protein